MNRALERTGVIVDRHWLWLKWLEGALDQAGIAAVACSTSLEHAAALVHEHQPALLVVGVDESVAESGYAMELSALRLSCPDLRIVVVSAARDESAIDAALRAGADAYCLRSARSDDLLAAIHQSFSRSIYLPACGRTAPEQVTPRGRREQDDCRRLTKRELEVLGLVAEGRSNPEVARLLWLTEQTVKFHLRNVFRKLDVANRVEASNWAHLHHVISPPPPIVARRKEPCSVAASARVVPRRPIPQRATCRAPSEHAHRTRGL